MEIGKQLLFFLAGLGVFNGLLLATYFLGFVKPKRWVNQLFGFLLLMLCFRIGKSLFHVFMDLDRIYLQIGLSACMMIGPFLFLYVRHFLNPNEESNKADALHLLIPLFTIIGIGSIWPYENYPVIWNKQVIRLIYGTWAIYTLVRARSILPLLPRLFKKQTSIRENWILLVYACAMILCLAYILAYLGFPYLAGPILFSVVLYLMMGFLAKKDHLLLITQVEAPKYQNQKLSETKAEDLLQRLTDMMQKDRVYLNQQIKLAQVAGAIDSTPHEVSQVINDRLGISFNHYINKHRVKAACQLLGEADHLTIEGIGQEVGFKSRSAFYTAFKNSMNQTPTQFKNQLKHSES